MHGQICPAIEQCFLQLLDEQALAAHLGKRRGQPLVTPGRDTHELHLKICVRLAQTLAYELGLPQREFALPGGDTDQILH